MKEKFCMLNQISPKFVPKGCRTDNKPEHDDVIKWKHFPRNWPFVRKIHRSPVNFPHKGQWRGALMFSLIYVWINDWANNREAGDLRSQHGHYDVIVMSKTDPVHWHIYAAPGREEFSSHTSLMLSVNPGAVYTREMTGCHCARC